MCDLCKLAVLNLYVFGMLMRLYYVIGFKALLCEASIFSNEKIVKLLRRVARNLSNIFLMKKFNGWIIQNIVWGLTHCRYGA